MIKHINIGGKVLNKKRTYTNKFKTKVIMEMLKDELYKQIGKLTAQLE
jgi:hypothetical protein